MEEYNCTDCMNLNCFNDGEGTCHFFDGFVTYTHPNIKDCEHFIPKPYIKGSDK